MPALALWVESRVAAARTGTLKRLKPSYPLRCSPFRTTSAHPRHAWVIAFWLRFNLDIPEVFLPALAYAVAAAVPLHALIFWSLGTVPGQLALREPARPEAHRARLR